MIGRLINRLCLLAFTIVFPGLARGAADRPPVDLNPATPE